MAHDQSAGRWWLLTVRAGAYILFGVFMFLFANSFSTQAALVLGMLLVIAGAAGLVFGLTTPNRVSNNFWLNIGSSFDVAFGIAILTYATGTVKGFVDVLGFWAMMYAFLQSVQAMYVFMSERRGPKANFPVWVLHFLSLVASGGLTFLVLLRPAGFRQSLGVAGLFPIILGVLLLLIGSRLRAQIAADGQRMGG